MTLVRLVREFYGASEETTDQWSRITIEGDVTHIFTQYLKILGIWVISFIYPIFYPFIVGVRFNYSHLKLNNFPLV
jgi:hypothetical protein